MRIAVYAPLKSPNHPVVSGDRQMARLLIRALGLAGYTVELASELRSFLPKLDKNAFSALGRAAAAERQRLQRAWIAGGPPDLWLTYHPYYKSPDLVGPPLAGAFAIPYVTVEASYARKRDAQAWAPMQEPVVRAIAGAAVNISFTARDREGLLDAAPGARVASMLPFIDVPPPSSRPAPEPGAVPRLVAVGMMRPGDKLASYRLLAEALARIADRPWRLAIVGDGPEREAVRALFAGIDAARLNWLGELPPEAVAARLAEADLYVWPGCGEAFGLAYLEAQAAGLPVVAQATAGVPAVVRDGETGLLTPEGDVDACAAAIAALLGDAGERARLGANARAFVSRDCSLQAAARRLRAILSEVIADAA